MSTQNGNGHSTRLTLWDSLYDFLDDIFGGAIPGAYFMAYFLLLALFVAPADVWEKLGKLGNGAVIFIGIALCYSFGTIFRRSEIKVIDKKSAKRAYKEQDEDEKNSPPACAEPINEGMVKEYLSSFNELLDKQKTSLEFEDLSVSHGKQNNWKRLKKLWWLARWHSFYPWHWKSNREWKNLLDNIKAKLYPTMEYPYTNMRAYVYTRGLRNVAQYANWCEPLKDEGPRAPQKNGERSKMKTNEYKLQIISDAPELLPVINKNEAHIRFLTSMWYAAHFLLYVTAVVLAAAIALILLKSPLERKYAWDFLLDSPRYFPVVILSVLFLVSTFYIKHKITKIMHYQRVREVVFILEAYAYAQKKKNTQEPKVQIPIP